MVADSVPRVVSLWRRLNRLDRVALAVVALYAVLRLASAFRVTVPGGGFVSFLFFFSLAYFAYRSLGWVRGRLLWSLRNRLIVAYLFIAVVPVLLLLVMVALSAYILYWQLGAHVVYDDVQKRLDEMSALSDEIAAVASDLRSGDPLSAPGITAQFAHVRAHLPGLEVHLNAGQALLRRFGGPDAEHFRGLVQIGDRVWLQTVAVRSGPAGKSFVLLAVPVSPELLDSLAPEIGPLQVSATRLAAANETEGTIAIGSRRYLILRAGVVSTRHRALAPPAGRLDYVVDGVAKLDAVSLAPAPGGEVQTPVLLLFKARPSQLNRRLFSSLGEIGSATVTTLVFFGVLFLALEVAALVAGIALTRTITRAVSELYRATQYVQAGDFTHRIRLQHKDQLGALGESFNMMTSSIRALIEEQRQRQRLENELSIAREVQAQLFPQELPAVSGVELECVCHAARGVSGDYYDVIRLGPTQLGLAIADISGKGISAALLMASLQAALRSQVLLDGHCAENTAELVARLNRHLYLNTSQDRFATFFYAVYDAATRALLYTNAGHLPPLYIVGERVSKLEEGGMVVGVVEDSRYDQGVMRIEPGSLLVAYSDGLIEPENVYGEEFGVPRLVDVVVRHRDASPRVVAQSLLAAVEEWAGTAEQADDMTVMVARFG